MAAAPLIDRAFLERLERLTIHWSKSFPGLVGGHNPSRFAGAGQEFLDHRHFHAGDDLRAVNWRAYMRLEKLFLKMFQIEPRVPIRLLLDISDSMTTGDGAEGTPKFDYVRKLAAALCYVGLVRLDTIHLQPYSHRLLDPFICSGGRHRFLPAVDYLTALKPAGRSDWTQVSRAFLAEYTQRGLVIILSDFLEEGPVEKSIQYLADFGHELLLIHVWAQSDRVPPWEGELDLIDIETGGQLEITFDARSREQYTRSFDAYAASLQRLALQNHGRYVGLSTSVPVEEALFSPLMRSQGVA